MSDFKIAWRIGAGLYFEDEGWKEVLKLIDRKPDTADEIAIIISDGDDNPAFTPLENKKILVDKFSKRAADLRARGKSVGINVWPTLDLYALERQHYNHFQRMIGIDGSVVEHLACPISDDFLEYIKEKYRILASGKPDFIWVDDDCRFTHMNGNYPCFCPKCVNGFLDGKFACREELVNALNNPQNRDLRIKWSEYGADRLATFCKAVREAVDEIDPSIDTPLMTVGATHTTFAGDYIEKCMKALRCKRGRPGHGFYSESKPDELMWKMMEAGRQIAEYPEFTTDIMWEEDSHPQNHLNKSFRTRRNEITLALMAGCNGIAFNHQNSYRGIDKRLAREIDELSFNVPRWKRLNEFLKGLDWCGAMPFYSWFLAAKSNPKYAWLKEDPFGENPNIDMDITIPEKLGVCGIPLTSNNKTPSATLLSGKTITSLSKDELEKVFSGNVYMDGSALAALEEMGMAELAGVTINKAISTRKRIIFTDHPFNGPFAGYSSNTLFKDTACLNPLFSEVEWLGYHIPPTNQNEKLLCTSKFQNKLGGKVVVNAFDAWYYNNNPHDLYQLTSIFEWFDLPLTVRYEDPFNVSRIQPLIRTNGKRAAVFIVNAFLDSTSPFEIKVKGDMTKAVLVHPDASEEILTSRREGDRICVSIPQIEPWDIATILLY
ncbi:MAG: hypothetical protein E7551_08955 [Ruminococcaceae bacterium]|nr:hypothetical protein [Oscillospiraceae bacterium]